MAKPWSEMTEEQKEKSRERMRRWREAHPYSEWSEEQKEKSRERARKRYAEHPLTEEQKEKKKEYHRQWRAKHGIKLRVPSTLTPEERKARERERIRKWQAEHPLTEEQKQRQRENQRRWREARKRVSVCEDELQMQRQALKMRILNEQMLDNLIDVDDDGINCVDGENFESFETYDEMTDLEEIRNRKEFYEGWQKEVKKMDKATMQELASASPFEYHPEDYNQNSTSDMHLYWWGDE